jgi:hypothetical protein
MSYNPNALGRLSPTPYVRLTESFENQAYSPNWSLVAPKLYAVVLPARHAYSHSASVGKRYVRPDICSRGTPDNVSFACASGLCYVPFFT